MVVSVVLLSLPIVQTKLAKIVTNSLNKTYNTNIVVQKVDLSYLGNVKLKGVQIDDHHNDTLIYVNEISTSVFSYKNILDNKLEFGEVDVSGLYMHMKTYNGEEQDNLSVFIDKFDSKDSKPSTTPFLLTSSKLNIDNANFYLFDKNKQEDAIVYYKNIIGIVDDFKIEGPKVYANVRRVSLVENHGIEVKQLTSNFIYTKTKMTFDTTYLETKNSNVSADFTFNYNREDLADFNNRVQIDAVVTKAEVSLIDLNKFYSEIGLNDKVNFTTNLKGTLNDFKLTSFELESNRKSIINGHFHFKNAINKENGFSLTANINELTSNYENLKIILPNLLGENLPPAVGKLGRFSVTGQSFITTTLMNADVIVKTDLGKIITNLKMTDINDINNAKYIGEIEFVDLEFGKIIQDSLVGKLSLIADIKGKGFTLDHINTSINGNIFKHQYKGYTYNDIDINGVFKNKHFNGSLVSKDENLQMSFTGLADLSKKVYDFDFVADVEYSDFNKLNLFKRDSMAILKGKIDIKLRGNSLDNIAGEINFSNASYTNQNDNYFFTDFKVASEFQDSIRVVTINSTDIIEGKIKGIFKYNEIGKLATNSFAGIYANYTPAVVTKGQFIDFNFKIYNKIVDVFFPEVKIGANSTIKGVISSDSDQFELTVKSPHIDAYDNLIENIRLQIDNKNPIYNTLLSVDEIKTKYYNVADVNLVNVTLNDTLFFRTDFVGGKDLKEKYDLSFYHTINENNKSVVGLKKSNIVFKENNWAINPTNNNQNKIVFDKGFNTFAFDKFTVSHEDQIIDMAGIINGKSNKDLTLNLKNVDLNGITPYIDGFVMKGLVNGKVNYKQMNGESFPLANVSINDFYINDIKQGNLFITAQGDNSIDQYHVAARLTNDRFDVFVADGEIDFSVEQPTILANYNFYEFNINSFSDLGKDVLTNIRGKIKGNGTVSGLLENPDFNGTLTLDNAGLKIPYLNVDFDIANNSKVELSNRTFKFLPTTITDIDKNTTGSLYGSIIHYKFKKWYLNLNIDTDNLLVLNTVEDEDVQYYGTAFMDGTASIKGYTDQLTINVEGATMPGTEFIVPLSDVSTIGDSGLINFVTLAENGVDKNKREEVIFDKLKGLNLNFDLEVRDNAIAEIVIDKNTGSILRGSGNGYMGIEINTNGKFVINGVYVITNGIYEFRNIVNKDFIVQPGGQVIWNGNPFDAFLNIKGIYKTKANPSVLLDNIDQSSNRKIDVNLIAKITGQLLNSDIDFDIELVNQNSSINSELDFKLSNEDAKMTQFFSLLMANSFMPLSDGNLNFDGNAALTGNLSEKIAKVLSGILKSKGDKFELGVTYDIASKNDVRSYDLSDQLGVSFSSTIADRLIVNGKVGVPVSTNTQQNNIVGEVEVELPLNEEGTLRAKAYTRQNDIEYDVTDVEGYTHGIGLSWRVDYDNTKELVDKLLQRSDRGKQKKKVKDSLKAEKKLINIGARKKDSIPSKVKN
ncbi:translocation/assembly module TamB [Aureibaculum algae]|uniref:Translocation/assembly module TamB n=1 Tax=Aureibaculum algae TaxID=2584122 RepID=A0A5B7TS94_9FLAO|nr:translocation/assembly module TamB domain-containing protein [Aureibaculum algae]QCX37867.1 translocation/assembly module TamB [Aureibaculum algae]